MKTSLEVLLAVARIGGRLTAAGGNLRMHLPTDCPMELKDAIRQHKAELLGLLESQATNLLLDCTPWLHVAHQVMAGEFDGADRSTVQSLIIGLSAIQHPLCQEALAVIKRCADRSPSP